MAGDEEPPDGVRHYSSAEEVPSAIAKYWDQRYNIFSRFDDGIWMTDDAWFGVTPEPVALTIAQQIAAAPATKTILIDCFAGAGGNTIAFALSGRWSQIFAVEQDAATLACAKHNAELYGVGAKIWWIHGDIFTVLKSRLRAAAKNAVIFGSPPWGGPTYADYEVFDVDTMQPYSFDRLYTTFSMASDYVVLYLPRTSDLRQIARHAKDGERFHVLHYCMYGASKAICVFSAAFQLE